MKDHELATLGNSDGRELKLMPDGIWRMYRTDGSVISRGPDWRAVVLQGVGDEAIRNAAKPPLIRE